MWHQQYFSGNTPQDKRVEPLLKQAMKTGWLMLAPASTRSMLEQYCASALLNRQADCSHKKWDVIERVGLFEDWLAPPLPWPLKAAYCTSGGTKILSRRDRSRVGHTWVSTFDLGWYISHKQPLWTAEQHSWIWIRAAVLVNSPVMCHQGVVLITNNTQRKGLFTL